MSTDYTLAYGTHATPDEGRCAMEWVSYIAGEPHSDEPACVSPAVRAFCTTFNDSLEEGPRQRLRPYLARTIGTAADGLDEMRAWLAMDWLIRMYTPTWLAAAGHRRSRDAVADARPGAHGPGIARRARAAGGRSRRGADGVARSAGRNPRGRVGTMAGGPDDGA